MSAVALDTLEFFETLKEAGVPDKQAKAFSAVIRKSHNVAEYATKDDMRGIEKAIRYDMEKMDTDIRNEVEKTKSGLQNAIEKIEASLRHEIGDLRKDMDAKFGKVDARFDAVDARFDKMSLQLTVRLGVMIPVLVTILPYIAKILHLPTP